MKRRILSMITALALCWSLCPTWAFAYEGEWEPDTGTDTGLCAHHTEHTDACGYIAPSEGQPCGHAHTDDCYTIAEDGSEVLDCQHTHDSECGYIQATPGASCGYECPLCPIDALIAALPRALTDDNAETVRWQLDEILDLWRELSEDEQDQIDLTLCYDLLAELDEANAPLEVTSIPQKAKNPEETMLEVGSDFIYEMNGTAYNCIVVSSTSNEAAVVWKEMQNPESDLLESKQSMILSCEEKGGRLIKYAEYQALSDYQIISLNDSYTTFGCQEYAACYYDNGDWTGDNTYTWTDWSYFIAFDLRYNSIEATENFNSEKYYDGTPFEVDTSSFTWKGTATPTIKFYSDMNGTEISAPFAVGTYYIKLSITAPVVEDGIRYEAAESDYIEITILPIITEQPEGAELYYGYTAGSILSVTTVVNGVAYQWYENNSAIDGATQATYTISTGKTVGTYQYYCKVSLGGYTEQSQTANVTVVKSGSTLESRLTVLNGETETTSFTASDTITVKATPTATGAAPAAMMAASFTQPSSGQMALFVGDTQVSEPVSTGADGTYTMTASASDVLTLAGVEPNGAAITLTAKFIGTSNMADAAATVAVTISASVKIKVDRTTTYYGGIGPAWAAALGKTATVTLLDDVTAEALDVSGGNKITLNGGSYTLSTQGFLVTGGQLDITGGMFELNAGLMVSGGTVHLSGGTFRGGIACTSGVASLLLNYGTQNTPHYAYFDEAGKPIALEEGQTSLSSPVTVQVCDHDASVCKYLPLDGGASHKKTCLACGMTWEAEPHTDTNQDTQCDNCKTQLVVKLGDVYYDSFDAAWDEANTYGKASTITLLRDVTDEREFDASAGSITFDGGEHTLTVDSISVYSGGSLTIASGTVKGSTFGVMVNGGTLEVTGGRIEAADYGIFKYGGTVRLSGGTITGGDKAIADNSGKVKDMLQNFGDTNAETHYAFYKDNQPFALPDGDSLPGGTYTVQECREPYTYTHTPGTAAHTQSCLYCGAGNTETACSFAWNGNTGVCACGAQAEVILDAAALTYNGKEQQPAVTVTLDGIELGADKYTVAYKDNTAAGDASVTVSGTGWSYEKDFTIKPATPTIAWGTDAQALTYTGRPAAITAPGVTLVNGETFSGTIKYSYTKDGTTYKTLPTDAGTYTITASVEAEGNYAAATTVTPLTLTIKQAEVTITWGNDAQTTTYTGKPAEITAPTVSAENGLTVSVTPEYSYKAENESTFTNGLPINAGTYTVRASIAASNNLTAAEADMTLTINKAPLTITGAEISEKQYNGSKEAAVTSVTFSGLVNSEELTAADYTATGAFDTADAGENKSVNVTVTLSNTTKANNYTLSSGTIAVTSEIKKAASTITTAPTAAGITYGQALSDSTLSGGAGSVPGTFAWTNGAEKPSAGTAQHEVTFTPTDTVNHNTATVNVSVTVAKATPNLTPPTASAIEYGQKLSDSTLAGGSAVNPNGNAAVAGKWGWDNGSTQPTATGNFPATFAPTDTANYETPAGVNVNVTVNPAEPKITITAPAYQIAGGTVEVKYTVANPHDATKDDLPAVALTYTIDGEAKDIEGTSFTIPEGTAVNTVITITATTAVVDGKYSAKTVTATVTVTDKIPVEITGVSVTGRAYNGTAIGYTGIPVIKTLDGKTVTDAKVTYTWSSGTAPTNAGGYSLTIAVNDGKYIGETTVNFTISKATITITAANKSATVGSAQPELTYTVSGLASGDELATKPTLTCDADMSKAGSYPITASGAAVPNTGNYETEITYVDGTLTVTAKPSTNPGSSGSGYVPPSTSTPNQPVTTTGQNSSYQTTTTTATPTASTSGGRATTTVDTAMGNEIVKQAVENRSADIVISPKVTGNVTRTEVSIPASTVGQIRSQTNASLTIATPVANVTIPNSGLGSLSSTSGTVTVTAEQTGNTVELTVTAGGRTVENIPGGVTLTVPAYTTPGTVAVLVHDNGTREVVRKSVADNGSVTIPLDGSAKLEIVDNSKYFYDVPSTSWAADAVAFASSHELFNGTGTNQFSPNLPMSRGMLATVLHNLESNPYQPISGVFADVNNSAWYAEGVAWAAANGIVTGYGSGQFGPNDNITREQLAVMLWRYAGSPAATDRELHFADAYRASDWALEALRWATQSHIINGKGNGILDPAGQATRAETAQMLKNFMENH